MKQATMTEGGDFIEGNERINQESIRGIMATQLARSKLVTKSKKTTKSTDTRKENVHPWHVFHI